MRARRPQARLAAAALDDHHGLDRRGTPHRGHELAAVLEALQVQGDQLGLGIAGQIVEEVHLANVRPVAVAYELREADAPGLGQRENRSPDGTALGDEGGPAGEGPHLDAGEQARGGVHDPGAVGPDQAQSEAPGGLAQDAFLFYPADFCEPGGEHHRRADPFAPALLDHGQGVGGGHRDQGKVQSLGHRGHCCCGPHGRELRWSFASGIHGVQRPGKPPFDELGQELVADLAGLDRADHGHGAWLEQSIENALRRAGAATGHTQILAGRPSGFPPTPA